LPVLDLLLLDSSNPRSLLFQLDGILKSLHKLARSYDSCGEQWLAPLKEQLLALDPDADLSCGNPQLISLLEQIRLASEQLSEHISVRFFSYTRSATDSPANPMERL
jgi:uncharacterized alpha-E superfamily protein